jgi:hypothetical protein
MTRLRTAMMLMLAILDARAFDAGSSWWVDEPAARATGL